MSLSDENVFKLIVGRDPDCRAEAVNFINGGAKDTSNWYQKRISFRNKSNGNER